MELKIQAGSSAEQRLAERAMLEVLSEQLGVTLSKQKLVKAEGEWVEIDGFATDPPVLVESWAHQGAPKSAQKAKVLTDALKLIWADSVFFSGKARKIVLFSDDIAAARFRPGSGAWAGAALDHFGIEVLVVPLPEDLREFVRRAQVRQFR